MYRTYRAVESVRYIYMKETETTLAKTISVAGVNAAYDNACKREKRKSFRKNTE